MTVLSSMTRSIPVKTGNSAGSILRSENGSDLAMDWFVMIDQDPPCANQ